MIVTSRKDANFLPPGNLFLVKDGDAFEINIDDSYASSAAQCLIENGSDKDFRSQAALVVEAINVYKWDVGSINNYKAFCTDNLSEMHKYAESTCQVGPETSNPERPSLGEMALFISRLEY